MFGTNVITGKSFFKNAPKDSLFITSMFFTLQGEMPFAGMPALFIRLTKCNLSCNFCDTFFDDGSWMTYEEIAIKATETIRNYWLKDGKSVPDWVEQLNQNNIGNFPNILLVITGGEPLLQENLVNFLNYVKYDISLFNNAQIESNGTVNLDIPDYVTLVCSPKCAEKNGVATKYLAPSKLILNRADNLKFVISSDQNSPYYTVPEWAHTWRKETGKNVFISPMNVYNTFPQKIKLLRAEKGQITMEERSTVDEIIDFFEPGLLDMKKVEQNHKYAAKYCIENGFRLSLQMHLYTGLA